MINSTLLRLKKVYDHENSRSHVEMLKSENFTSKQMMKQKHSKKMINHDHTPKTQNHKKDSNSKIFLFEQEVLKLPLPKNTKFL